MKEILVGFTTDIDEVVVVMRACKREMEELARNPTKEARSEASKLASFLKKLESQVFEKEDLQHIPEMNNE